MMIWLTWFLNGVLDAIVHIFAVFTARIVNHPLVQDAFANMIVLGMKKMCHSEDLHEHLEALEQNLRPYQETDAVQAGQKFSKTIGSFMKGVMYPDKCVNDLAGIATVDSDVSSKHDPKSEDGESLSQQAKEDLSTATATATKIKSSKCKDL